MSRFRAINRSSESPLKPTHERPLSDVVYRQTLETDLGQALASNPKQQRQYYTTRPGAVVTPQSGQCRSQPEGKTNIGQAVEKAKKAKRASKKKKKREAGTSTSEPRRQQVHREKKLVYSIEHSPRKTSASSTPECGTDGDYIPSSADLARITLSSPSSTSSRRSPREHPSRSPNSGSGAFPRSTLNVSPSKTLPQDGGTLAITKRESSPNLEVSSPSPMIWSTPMRQKIYEEHDFAELPREVFEYLLTENQFKKQLAIKKEIMLAGKRKEKGKFAEQRPVREMQGSTQKMGKRKAEVVVEDSEPRKRPKSQRSQGPSTEAHSTTNDYKILSEKPDTSKHISPRRSSKDKTMKMRAPTYETVAVKAEDRPDITGLQNKKVQRSFRAGAEAQDSRPHDQRPGQSDGQASRSSRQQKKSGWCKAYKRREVVLAPSCSCLKLHEHFTKDPSRVPSLEKFPEDEVEYFENIRQILICRGSLHTPHVVDVCKRMMLKEKEKQKRRDHNSLEPNFELAQGILSTDGQNDSNSRRAQSSIAPRDFYGNKGKYRNPANAGSSSRSEREVRRATPSLESHSTSRPASQLTGVIKRGSPSKSLPMRDRGKNATCLATAPAGRCPSPSVVINSSQSLTRPSPSPLVQSDSASCGQENVGAWPASKSPLPEAPSRHNQSLISFSTQRRRHQTVPVDMHRRDNTVNQRSPLPLPAQQQNVNPLQEISNNAMLHNLNRTIASLRDLVERFPAAPHIQIAAAQPVPPLALAPAPDPGPNAPNGDRGGQPPARSRRWKKPSVAEQKLTKPELDRNVPMHLRLSDEGIISIGRIVNWYERHRRAPYAFNWYGHLYKEYAHLLVTTIDGATVWTAEQIRRLGR